MIRLGGLMEKILQAPKFPEAPVENVRMLAKQMGHDFIGLARRTVAGFAFVLIMQGLGAGPVAAQNEDGGAPVQAHSSISIPLNKSRNIKVQHPFADASVGSPEIADIVPISDRQLYIVGKKPGTTNVLLYDREKRLIGIVDVAVRLDNSAIGSEIRGAAGSSGIQVQDVDGKVVLKGDGRDAPTIDRAMKAAAGIGAGPPVNALRLNSPQQVMLKVRFVEASRQAVRAFGIRWQGIINNRAAGVVGSQARTSTMTLSGLLPGRVPEPGGLAAVPGGAASGLVFDVVSNSLSGASPVATIITQLVNTSRGSLDAVISALEDNGVLRRLAEPNLVALSGENAEFLAGGEIPVPVVQGAGGGGLNAFAPITIQWKEYGVRLNFTPTVLANRVISLRLMPSVSDLDYQNAVTIQNIQIPALIKRSANTTVELRDGQTFAIAGLIQARNIKNIEQVPWLGSVPVLGALFRSSEFLQQETELVALVTPHLVEPIAPGMAKLKTPLDTTLGSNDVDLFLNGKLEVEKNPASYITPTGVEQPLQGGIAPGAPGDTPPSLAPADSIQQFFGAFFTGAPPAPPSQ